MMRHLQLRLALAVLSLGLLAAGAVGWARQGPLVSVTRAGISAGFLPFWAAACLLVGVVLLVLIIAVGEPEHFLQWSSPLLFLLWVVQFAALSGLFVSSEVTKPPRAFLVRWTMLYVRWWGLALVLLALIIIAVVSRSRMGHVGRSQQPRLR
jgi:hypothetical protein